MRKIFFALFALGPLSSVAQDSVLPVDEPKQHRVSVGLNAGLDNNFNAYRLTRDLNGFDYYSINPNFNLSLDLGVKVNEKLRPRIEFMFNTLGYGFQWGDDYPTFDKTETHLYYLGAGIRLDYLLLDRDKFEIYLSPAVKGETLINSDNETTKTDGSTTSAHYSVMIDPHPVNIAGASLSGIFKYKISGRLGITVSPEYTLFLRKFVLNNDKQYQRFRINLGIEFKL